MTFAELYNYDIEFYEYGWHPEDELEVIELGDRVSDHLTQEMFNTAFGAENDRIFGMIAAIGQPGGKRHLMDREKVPSSMVP